MLVQPCGTRQAIQQQSNRSPSPSAAESADSSSRLLEGKAAEPAARAPSKDTAVEIWLRAARCNARPHITSRRSSDSRRISARDSLRLMAGTRSAPQPFRAPMRVLAGRQQLMLPAVALCSVPCCCVPVEEGGTHWRDLTPKAPVAWSIRLRV